MFRYYSGYPIKSVESGRGGNEAIIRCVFYQWVWDSVCMCVCGCTRTQSVKDGRKNDRGKIAHVRVFLTHTLPPQSHTRISLISWYTFIDFLSGAWTPNAIVRALFKVEWTWAVCVYECIYAVHYLHLIQSCLAKHSAVGSFKLYNARGCKYFILRGLYIVLGAFLS